MPGDVGVQRKETETYLGIGLRGNGRLSWAIVHTYSLFFVVFLATLPEPVPWFLDLYLLFAGVRRGYEIFLLHKSVVVSEVINRMEPLAVIYIFTRSPPRNILHDLPFPFHSSILSTIHVTAISAFSYEKCRSFSASSSGVKCSLAH